MLGEFLKYFFFFATFPLQLNLAQAFSESLQFLNCIRHVEVFNLLSCFHFPRQQFDFESWKAFFNLPAGKSDKAPGNFLVCNWQTNQKLLALQFIAGIGVPVDLEPESMTIGYVFKAQYFLPYNVTQLKPTRLARDISDHMKIDKYGQVYESYDVEAKVKSVEVLPQTEEDDGSGDDDDVRWVIYQALEVVLNSKNIDGKQCVMRAICEASQLQFGLQSGLLGEIFHVLFVWVCETFFRWEKGMTAFWDSLKDV